MDKRTIATRIHARILTIAGPKAKNLSLAMDASIPDTGLLDSPALMELLVWYEAEFDLDIPQEDITVEHFGTIDSMAEYAVAKQGG